MTRSPDPGPFHLNLDPVMAAIAASRESFEAWLTGVGVLDGPRSELAVVFSELVSNATRAAADAGDGPRVDAWTEPDSVVLEVSNPICDDEAPVKRSDFDNPVRTGGRGLMIVRAYTDDLTITAADHTLTVRCRRLLT